MSCIQQQLCCLQYLLWSRQDPIFVSHIRGHTQLPGPLAKGNQLSEAYTWILFASPEEKASKLNKKNHLNARSLQHHTGFSRATALQMTTQCSACAPFHNTPIAGVNPRGLKLNDIWQMDVTHLPSAGKLKYMHVSVDTCFKVVFASLHSGEKKVRMWQLIACWLLLIWAYLMLLKQIMVLHILVENFKLFV